MTIRRRQSSRSIDRLHPIQPFCSSRPLGDCHTLLVCTPTASVGLCHAGMDGLPLRWVCLICSPRGLGLSSFASSFARTWARRLAHRPLAFHVRGRYAELLRPVGPSRSCLPGMHRSHRTSLPPETNRRAVHDRFSMLIIICLPDQSHALGGS
jgi:hypothetical protein